MQHIALIIDHERLVRERGLLERTSLGLGEHGCRVTVILPQAAQIDDEPEAELPLPAASHIWARMKVPPWMRRVRTRRVADALATSEPELLHAVGEQAWALGLDLAKLLDRPVTLDVWSAEQVRRVPHARAASHVAGYITPTEPIADALRQRLEPDLVSMVPFGVELPAEPRTVLADRDGAIALAIIGSGLDATSHRPMLTGLSRLTKEFPQIQACLELRGPNQHEIWRQARRLDLLGHISTIDDAALHRALLTGCDVLVVPERLGQVRSLILAAMALGMPVMANDDPYLDMLMADQTAIIVEQDDPDQWADNLRRLLTDPDLAPRIGGAARAWVAEHHRPDDHVESLEAAFQQVLSGGAHTFADADV
ncbi:MAG: glycosyltransferase family 4 protein [Planctomycetota bacterium]|jgi:glycosyltransferase involved in cell wall biosynthesis